MRDLDLDIDVMLTEVKSNTIEMKQLKKAFRDLVTTIKFRKESYIGLNNDANELMTLANAFTVFDEAANDLYKGICLNNIGIIHYRNSRYELAVKSFAQSA